MKTRWVYVILLLVFAVIGIHYNNTQVPNQQIVVQFQSSDNNLENSVNSITKQLQEIGVSQIKVQDSGEAQITITYYSHSDVASVEKILGNEGYLTSANPIRSKDSKTLQVNVSEIQATQNTAWDFEGTLVSEFKEHLDRLMPTQTISGFTENALLPSTKVHDSNQYNGFENGCIILNTSYQIPEVRAGPHC